MAFTIDSAGFWILYYIDLGIDEHALTKIILDLTYDELSRQRCGTT
jgi:hypothetical protein